MEREESNFNNLLQNKEFKSFILLNRILHPVSEVETLSWDF